MLTFSTRVGAIKLSHTENKTKPKQKERKGQCKSLLNKFKKTLRKSEEETSIEATKQTETTSAVEVI